MQYCSQENIRFDCNIQYRNGDRNWTETDPSEDFEVKMLVRDIIVGLCYQLKVKELAMTH